LRIVVVGASTAGLKCACRARRLLPAATITVLDARREISLAHGALPAFLAGEFPSLDALRTTSYGRVRDASFFKDVKGVDVRTGVRVDALDLAAHTVTAVCEDDGARETHAYDHLVLATGAASRAPAGIVPGPAVHLGHDPLHLRDLRRALERGAVDRVAVLGGGCVGVSLAGALAETWGVGVTLFEAQDRILPEVLDTELAAVASRALRDLGVEVRTGARVTAATTAASAAAVDVDGEARSFEAAIVALGVMPRVELARAAGLAVGPSGGLIVDQRLQCAPGVWACGDVVEVTQLLTGTPRLAGRSALAARMGRAVADGIAGRPVRVPPMAGSFALRIGETMVATVGITAGAAREAGLAPAVVWGSVADRAVIDPERRYDAVALVSEERTGRLLGLQAVGPGAAVRRAELMATPLRAGARLEDLLDLETCCHPAVGDLFDPLHGLAALALAVRDGGPLPVACETAAPGAVLVDVREASELTGDLPAIPGALNIPLGELATRFAEIPRDRPVVLYCARGPRSFEGICFLQNKGFLNILYLAGGVGLRANR
jgi:NADPH-dependent 2,4-dienoyl-CoA reductase/sulfur reductase-like enzyme/rhodanese-related sulfurtransferase